MTADISGFLIDTFANGRSLVYAAEPGVVSGMTKEGPIDLSYKAGDLILADKHGKSVCGPVGISGAVDLAERVLEGDPRALTDPLAMLVLAAAIVGFFAPGESGEVSGKVEP